MNDILNNQLDMIAARIAVAEQPASILVWQGNQPLDFGNDFALMKTHYAEALVISAQAQAATTGPAQAKDLAETDAEEVGFNVARACAAHLRKTGDATRLAKVNIKMRVLKKLRDQALVAKLTEIRDVANEVKDESQAMNRGVTGAKVAALSAAITAFANHLGKPRGAIVTRGELLRELETRVAALRVENDGLDDFAIQFGETPEGRAFIGRWKAAKGIVDAGHGPSTPPTPTPTPTP